MNRRRLILLALLFVLIPVAVVRFLSTDTRIADRVRLHFTGLSAEAEDRIRIYVADRNMQPGTTARVHKTSYFFVESSWISVWVVQIPQKALAQLEKLEVTIGDEKPSTFTGAEVRQWEKRPPQPLVKKEDYSAGDVLVFVPNVFGRTTAFPWVRSSRPRLAGDENFPAQYDPDPVPPWNWPGDDVYVREVLQSSLLPWLLVLLFAFLLVRCRSESGLAWARRVLGAVEPQSPQGTPAGPGRFWNWAGFLFLVAMFVMLEFRDPYYFTQDDNLIESLPMILVGCRSLWQGEFPDYNPYLFMGSPLASLGMYALTYPPLPLSYAIARHILGNEYATLEVFAILHLLVGFFATRLLGRRLGMGALAANLTALSCVLSGPALIMGRCWFNFIPVLIWLPILFLGLERLRSPACGLAQASSTAALNRKRRPVSWKWVIGMGLATGMTFHVGFTQAAIYLNAFLCVGAVFLIAAGALTWRLALALVQALLIGAGIAVPLVHLQWLLAQDMERFNISSNGIAQGLPAFLLPYPLVQASLPSPLGNINVEYLRHLYFFGGLLALLFFFQVVGLVFFRPGRQFWPGQLYTMCGLFALWLALGDAGGLWQAIDLLPLAKSINRYPMRVMPFVVFFAAVSGGLVLERLLSQVKQRWTMEWIVAVLALSLLAWHAVHCSTAFYTYQFAPYPDLPTEVRDEFFSTDSPQRVASWTRHRSSDPNYGLLLPLDVPAVYKLPTWDGYNPLLSGKAQMREVYRKIEENPAAALKAYGIRWNLTHSPHRLPEISTVHSAIWMEEVADRKHLLRRLPPENLCTMYDRDGIVISERRGVDALAFAVDRPGQCLPLTMRGSGLDVDLTAVGRDKLVVVNFLYHPEMAAHVDGRPVACKPDEWQRIAVQVGARDKLLELRYRPLWARGIWLGVAMIVLGVVIGMFSRARSASK